MLHDARPRKRTRIGADVVCEALLRQGVDVFFSYPGGVILPLYDILGDYPELRHVLVRHEQGGAHAADGYARVTGRVGVCMGTSGPGRDQPRHRASAPRCSTRSRWSRSPATCPAALIGKDAFQEIDINGITLPMTKHNYLVRDADDLPARRRRGVPHRPHRPARARSTSTSPRTPSSRRRRAEHPTEDEVVAGLPGFRPNMDGHPRQLKLGRRRDRRGQAAGHPRRPRRPPRRGLGRAASPSPRRPRSRSPGRCSGSARSTRRTRWPTATWACTAGSTSTGRSSRPTC